MTHPIIQKLQAGDLRTTGQADAVVTQVLKNNSLIKILIKGLENNHPGVRMRSADALEKVSRQKPSLIQPHKKKLLHLASTATQQEVQWHLAKIISYLKLSKVQENKVKDILFKYLETTTSNIVITFSIQTLFEISQRNKQLKPEILSRMNKEYKKGSPAVRKRIEKLKI